MFEEKIMKTLVEILKESLLDDLDDLIDTSDKNVKHVEVNNPDFISIYGDGWKIEGKRGTDYRRQPR